MNPKIQHPKHYFTTPKTQKTNQNLTLIIKQYNIHKKHPKQFHIHHKKNPSLNLTTLYTKHKL